MLPQTEITPPSRRTVGYKLILRSVKSLRLLCYQGLGLFYNPYASQSAVVLLGFIKNRLPSHRFAMSFLNLMPSSMLPLIEPGILLYYAVHAYVTTLLSSLSHFQIPSLSQTRSNAFGTFWSTISGAPPDPSVSLAGSAALVPPLLARASGVVLDVGPGSGNLTGYFEPAATDIKAIYGAEPAVELHQLLRRNVAATKLAGKYTVLSADATGSSIARELAKAGVVSKAADASAMFDTIICIRVLCSVPNLESTLSDLHALLKPGGRLMVVEHTVNPWRTPKGSVVARLFQTMYMLVGWSYFVGDCSLTRDIERMLRTDSAKRWESVDIERHFGYAVFTYISGVLVKKR